MTQQFVAALATFVTVAGGLATLAATLVTGISRSRARESARFWLETAKALPTGTEARAEAEALHLMAASRLAAAARPRLLSDGWPWLQAWVGFIGVQGLVLLSTAPVLTSSTPATPEQQSSFVFMVVLFGVVALVGTGLALSGFARVRDRRLRERSRFIGVPEPDADVTGITRFARYGWYAIVLVSILVVFGLASISPTVTFSQPRLYYWLISIATQFSVIGYLAVMRLFDAKNRESELYIKTVEIKRGTHNIGEDDAAA